MKKVLYLFLLLYSSASLGQEQNKRLTFILSIDNEVTITGVTDGVFLLRDSTGAIKDKLPFDYHVGGLIMSPSDYKKLFSYDPKYRISIKFKYTEFRPRCGEHTYEEEIPKGWLNEEYMIFNVYNASNKGNRAKYFFKPGQEYLIQIKIPSYSTILITHGKYYAARTSR